MALLNSKNYSGLANYSTALPREAGPFLNVFITGEPRDGQDVAKLQCMVDFDGKKYQENNKSELYFVIMYVKRFWEKVVTNNGRDSVVAFGWKDDNIGIYLYQRFIGGGRICTFKGIAEIDATYPFNNV